MFRLYFLTLSGEQRDHHAHPHESPATMTIPLIVLATGAALVGYVGLPIPSLNLWEHFLAPVFGGSEEAILATGSHGLELGLMGVSSLVAFTGIGLAWWMYRGSGRDVPARLATTFAGLHKVLWNKYWVDEAYDLVIVRPLKAIAHTTWKWIDAGLVDGVLVNGPARVISAVGGVGRRLATGDVQAYAAALAVGLAVIVFLFM
jgi:NADH-quinone oxidoreductase subunit L